MRLIDADALIDEMSVMVPWVIESPEENARMDALSDAYEAVKNAPTIDAVPVVRCRECQKWKKTFELDNRQVFGTCDRFYGAETEDSFFCRDGQ